MEVKILNAPRLNKKCLVLDIDYTLFDLGSNAERPEELARPCERWTWGCCKPLEQLIASTSSIFEMQTKVFSFQF